MPSRANSALIRTGLAALILTLVFAASVAARATLADIYAEPAKVFLQAKRDAGEALTPEEWQAVYDNLSHALVLAPGDPRNLSELGRLHRIVLEADDLDADVIARYGKSAAGYYAAALAVRPTWPWDWGNLALVEYEQYQDSSPDFHNALLRTVEFGPREASLQNLVIELGVDSWERLSPAAMAGVLTAVDRALERESESIEEAWEMAELWRLFCVDVSERLAHLSRRCRESI